MSKHVRDSERTKAAILDAATELFSGQNYKRVKVRDVAAAAGVTHALVFRYFGTKENLVNEILKREIEGIRERYPKGLVLESPEKLARALRGSMVDRQPVQQLIVRSELSGFQPEQMLGHDVHPYQAIADWIVTQRPGTAESGMSSHDPALVAAVVAAAITAFATVSPWVLTFVGLRPEDYESRQDEILDILLDIIVTAAGVSSEAGAGCSGQESTSG